MIETRILVMVEERLNSMLPAEPSAGQMRKEAGPVQAFAKVDPELMQVIAQEAERNSRQQTEGTDPGSSLYCETVIPYIKRLRDARFLKKNGEVREAAFYEYACIDKTTWSDFKWGKVKPSKKTILKLIFALQLSRTEALAFLQKGNCVLDPRNDPQDLVISCILDYEESTGRQYTVDDVMEILDTCRDWGKTSYDSIYDTPEMIAERKREG